MPNLQYDTAACCAKKKTVLCSAQEGRTEDKPPSAHQPGLLPDLYSAVSFRDVTPQRSQQAEISSFTKYAGLEAEKIPAWQSLG